MMIFSNVMLTDLTFWTNRSTDFYKAHPWRVDYINTFWKSTTQIRHPNSIGLDYELSLECLVGREESEDMMISIEASQGETSSISEILQSIFKCYLLVYE